ncbi:MAG TPA: cytochrome c oxidase assembly protein [Solirubrobacteraceae bacterium]|nr:cytochrome c oxidase assembly protein [Solirubrobacteraceae bacterium]
MSQVPNWGSWSFNPLVILVLGVAAVLYARAYRRAAARSAAVGAGHWVPYGAGLLVVAIALMSPLDPIGDSYLLSAHMAQHVLLSDIAPALLVLGLRRPLLPLGLSRGALQAVAPGGGRFGRLLARLTSPWVAIPLWATATWVWAIPAVFDFAAEHSAVHAFEHLTLFYTGLALWWLIIDPLPRARLRPGGQRLALLGFSRLASAAVCLPLTWLAHPEYPLYATAPRVFGLSAINDQHLAGAGMCFMEFLVFGIAFAAVFISILSRSDEGTAVAERAAGERLLT